MLLSVMSSEEPSNDTQDNNRSKKDTVNQNIIRVGSRKSEVRPRHSSYYLSTSSCQL